jgi:hypothetical protein
MAANVTPVDNISGVAPLSILFRPEVMGEYLPGERGDHHTMNPWTSADLQGIDGKTMRVYRFEHAHPVDHIENHAKNWEPSIPKTADDRNRLLLPATQDYIAEEAFNPWTGERVIIERKRREQMWAAQEIWHDRGLFAVYYGFHALNVIAETVPLDDELVTGFLSTRQHKFAQALADQALKIIVRPAAEDYRVMLKEGFLKPDAAKTPEGAAREAMSGTSDRFRDALRGSLRARRDGRDPAPIHEKFVKPALDKVTIPLVVVGGVDSTQSKSKAA